MKSIFYHPFIIKLFNWEYWPFHFVYGPIYIVWFLICLRARSFFFFNTSNPSIRNGGFLMESKKEIYDLIPEQYYPPTLFFTHSTDPASVADEVRKKKLHYPLVGKPDIGMKGMLVKKIENENELITYATESKVDFLVQEFIPYKNEVGIFYYRLPDKGKGNISGIVRKEFLTVIGDGKSTVKELLQENKRYILQLPVLERTEAEKMSIILKKGEELMLVPYGNHIRGAKFVDDTRLSDEALRNTIDELCKQVKGFYYGRMDVRYNTWEELKLGKNFSIIELNGAGSEPTHMYDPRHSIFFAWKEIIRHWNILYKISKQNRRRYNTPYMSVKSGLEMFRQNSAYLKLLNS